MRLGIWGGPASDAGPRFFPILTLCAGLAGVWNGQAFALDWIPPRLIVASLPSATLAPSSTHSLELTVLSSGGAATLQWSATTGGQFPCAVSPAGGLIAVPAGGTASTPLSVTLPDTALGFSLLTVELTRLPDGGRADRITAQIYAATGGRPEVRPVPGTWQAAAGTAGSVSFEIHSLIGGSESIVLTTGRTNPDPNNQGAIFGGSAVPSPVMLPGGATITVGAPTTIPTDAYAGNRTAIQLNVSSGAGVSSAAGVALATTTGSVPTSLAPVGLTSLDAAATSRDGAAPLTARGYWLLPSGTSGIQVLRAASLDTIGIHDPTADGLDDRLIGTVRIPSYAAALGVIPGFVNAASETLDVGLLAAGRAGLMLLDLRLLEDPSFGSWEELFDVDMNGIDDRILRTIPLSGFATDVAWLRAPSGRYVALVADADTGSVPVATTFNPASVVAGTGQGVVAVDVTAALDPALPPYAAGTLATPGSVTDLEIRSGGNGSVSPDLAIADGASGVALYGLSVSAGAPAVVTFNARGSLALSSAWGTPYARDIAWVSSTKDSLYAAVAAGPGGLQIVRLPATGGGAPLLAMSQQTLAPAIGVAGAWTGALATAMGSSGMGLFRTPLSAALGQIATGAPAPYTAPVTLARGAAWGGTGAALEVGAFLPPAGGATALRFEESAGPVPDLLVSDGPRLLVLRPGSAVVTAVESSPPAAKTAALRLSVAPNPIERGAVFDVRVVGDVGVGGGATGASRSFGATRIEIYDVRGRLLRRLNVPASASGGQARIVWDGRDRSGLVLPSGRYWARVTATPSGPATPRDAVVPILIVR